MATAGRTRLTGTLRTAYVEEWLGNEAQGQASSPDEPIIGHTTISGQEVAVQRFMGMPPDADSIGDIQLRDLLAGQIVGRVRQIEPAGEIVRELVEEIDQIFGSTAAR